MKDTLDLQITYRAIVDSARKKQFISYSDLAAANSANFPKVRYKLNSQLGELMSLAVEREWPILSSIVVSKPNLDSGTLEGTALEGFVDAARKLGFTITDSLEFVEKQQKAVFNWASDAPDDLGISKESPEETVYSDGPKFVQYFGPVLDALRKLGGSANRKNVIDTVGEVTPVTDEDLEAKTKGGQSQFENQVGWARFYLCKAGLIDSNVRGRWMLTTEGRETHLDQHDALALFKDVYARFRDAKDVDNATAPSEDLDFDLFGDPDQRFWFVGALWGDDDQSDRFIGEGYWKNGYETKYADQVKRMKPGDLIAIKASFTKKYGLPFENYSQSVSCMRIKAIGTITEGTQDGRSIKVDWTALEDLKDWYFYTYRTTIVEADVSDPLARRLIQFTFGDYSQDYGFWLSQTYWARKYSPTNIPTDFDDREETDSDVDEDSVLPYGVAQILEEGCFLDHTKLSDTLERLNEKKNVILQGPPGTGKTWLAKRLAYALIGTRDRRVTRKRLRAIQFHPSLSYEDFVRGWRPAEGGKLKLIDGLFLEAIDTARAEPDRPFVVVIEEINRGNPSQIFGELLTLLESDKRREDEAIELAYRRDRDESVFIPHNLFVIGTMNIADRSLALVDLALRRRFAFVSLEPMFNETWKKWCCQKAGIGEDDVEKVERLLTDLNDEIDNDPTLGTQFRIGHSYVTPAPTTMIDDTRVWFRHIVETEISPLLEEYWFDSPKKASDAKEKLLNGI